MAKDPQKQRVYSAERRAGLFHSESVGTSIQDCQAYVDRLLARKGVRKIISSYDNAGARRVLAHGITLEVNCGSHATMIFGLPHIRLRKSQFNVGVIIHEISHLISWRTEFGHDATFVKAHLELSQHIVGKVYADRLRASFNIHRVKVLGDTGKAMIPRVPVSQREWHTENIEEFAKQKKHRCAQRAQEREWQARRNIDHALRQARNHSLVAS
jgi:putative metallohydrolase (TIGR04338 family)